MTNPNIEQLTAAQKANAEVMVALVHTAFNGVEKIAELNLAAARDFLNSSVNGTQTLLGAKDVQEAAKLLERYVQPKANALQFSVDSSTGSTVVRVVDSSTGDLVRQIPSEEVIRIAESIDQFQGLMGKIKA